MRKNLEREVVAATLSGGQGTEPILALVTKGLDVLRSTRRTLRDAGLTEALSALRSAKAGRSYVRAALPRGAHARFHLTARDPGRINGFAFGLALALVTVHSARGATRTHHDVPPAAADLARLVGTDVEAATRILLGLERARRRCYELAEEATRWL